MEPRRADTTGMNAASDDRADSVQFVRRSNGTQKRTFVGALVAALTMILGGLAALTGLAAPASAVAVRAAAIELPPVTFSVFEPDATTGGLDSNGTARWLYSRSRQVVFRIATEATTPPLVYNVSLPCDSAPIKRTQGNTLIWECETTVSSTWTAVHPLISASTVTGEAVGVRDFWFFVAGAVPQTPTVEFWARTSAASAGLPSGWMLAPSGSVTFSARLTAQGASRVWARIDLPCGTDLHLIEPGTVRTWSCTAPAGPDWVGYVGTIEARETPTGPAIATPVYSYWFARGPDMTVPTTVFGAKDASNSANAIIGSSWLQTGRGAQTTWSATITNPNPAPIWAVVTLPCLEQLEPVAANETTVVDCTQAAPAAWTGYRSQVRLYDWNGVGELSNLESWSWNKAQ